jgi:hypothetical protein
MVPFFVLADVFSPAHADRGLVSTRFLVSLPPEVFKQYLGQLGHAGLLERAPLSLQHAQWSASTTRTLEKLFNQLLTRSLLRYLLAVCFADDEQQQRIAAHAPRATTSRCSSAARCTSRLRTTPARWLLGRSPTT